MEEPTKCDCAREARNWPHSIDIIHTLFLLKYEDYEWQSEAAIKNSNQNQKCATHVNSKKRDAISGVWSICNVCHFMKWAPAWQNLKLQK
jgi:hypothetical protein